MLGTKAADIALFTAVATKLKSKPSENASEQAALLKPQKDKTSESAAPTGKETISASRDSSVDLTEAAPKSFTDRPTASSSESTTTDSAAALGGGKSDQLLTKIAANFDTSNQNLSLLVHGFNKLAGALGQLGVSIAENPSGNTILNSSSGGGGGQAQARTTEIAKGGNQEIANFRASIEKMKQRPA